MPTDWTVRAITCAMAPVLLPLTLVEIASGLVLGSFEAALLRSPTLLVLVPVTIGTAGNLGSVLAARLSTALHQGLVQPRVRLDDERLRGAVAAAIANGLLASAFAATVAFLVLTGLGRTVAPLWVLLAVALLGGVLSGLALTATVVAAVFAGFRRGYNPDTLVGPVVTTAGDVFGVAFLLLAVRAVLLVSGGGG